MAATLDGGSGAMSIYTNGVLAVQTVTGSRPFGNLLPDQSPGVGIGNLNDGGNNFPFLGDVDEIGLYNRALSAGEIQSIYNAGSAGKCVPTCTLAPSGLVSWWKGDGNGNDSLGMNNATAPDEVTYVPAEVGQGFNLDGQAHQIVVPDAPELNFSSNQNFSIEVWIQPLANPNNFKDIMSVIDKRVAPDTITQLGYEINLEGGVVTFQMADILAPYSWHNFSGGPDLRDGQFHHVAVTVQRNSTTGGRIYIDGQLVLTFDPTVCPGDLSNPGPLRIGNHATPGLQAYYHGIIDEVSLYKRALSSIEISAIYNAGSAGKCAPAPPAVPAIAGFAPAMATNGATLTISGGNFSSTAASNIVYFGAVRATVLSASPTSLQVAVPPGATFAPVTVTVNGLTTYSPQPFLPTFVGAGLGISPASFGPRQDLASGIGPIQVVIADLDNDGKPDLIVANDYNNTISLYRNISTNHTLTAASFAPPVDLATPPGSYSPYGIVAADVDGDGKLDIIATDYSGPSVVSVYRNTCTPGNISSNNFATRVDFPTGTSPQGVAVADIDGDGRPDLLVANTGDGTVSILRNTSVVGSLTADSFAPKVDFATGGGCANVTAGDLDGDGIPDVATANSSGTISLLRNISSPGTLAFDTKVDFVTPDGALHVKLVDLDGDGKLDLAVESYLPQTLSVFRNTSTIGSLNSNSLAPRIDYALGGRGHTTAVGDLDGDGKPDLAVATELDSLISIFHNTGTPGSFTNSSLAGPVNLATGWNAWGVAVGDLDGDGRPDVVFANSYDNNISIYQNQSPVAGPPVITAQPASQTTMEGLSVILSVTAGGVPPFGYQWTFNGSPIAGATNATLTLGNLHPNQTGNYAVIISSAYGRTTSSSALVTVPAQTILIYKYSGIEKMTSSGLVTSNAYAGEFFFIPDTTNGIFVGWSKLKGTKQYWVNPLAGYLLFNISGASGQTFTVLGQAGQEIDGNAQPHLWFDLHKGQNIQLTIGKKKTFSFPGTFADNATHIYPDSQTGKMILDEATSAYTFLSKDTQAANNNGQTVADLVNVLTKALVAQGYQSQ